MPVGHTGWRFSDGRMGHRLGNVRGMDGGVLLPSFLRAVRRRQTGFDRPAPLAGERAGPAGLLLHDTPISVASSETNFSGGNQRARLTTRGTSDCLHSRNSVRLWVTLGDGVKPRRGGWVSGRYTTASLSSRKRRASRVGRAASERLNDISGS